MLNSQQRPVQLDSIYNKEDWSLSPFNNSDQLDQLRSSINRVGILHPPILQKTGKNSFKVINGRKRVQIALEQKLNPLHCLVLSNRLPIQQVLTIHLTEQQLSGPLSTIEQTYFLQLCLRFVNEKDLLNIFLPLLGYPSQKIIIGKLLGFLHLENKLQSLLHEQFISEKTASILLKLDKNDRTFMGDLFVELKLGQGKQQRLLTLCGDLSHRHSTSIEIIFSDLQIKRILEHTQMNTPQKTNRIFDFLQKQHNSRYYKAKEDFTKQMKQLDLPDNCTLTHSSAFEKNDVALAITFEDIGKCEKIWKTIRGFIKDNNNASDLVESR